MDTGLKCTDWVPEIDWVDEFVRRVSPHIRVRRPDQLLIVLPNQAYKVNDTGLAVLEAMLDGDARIEEVLRRIGDRPETRESLHEFFCDLRALVVGCLGEGEGRRAVETIPYQRPINVLPVLSEIAVTYRCNLRCIFCYAGCGCTCISKDGGEMSTKQVLRVLDIVANEARVPSVSLTGGEPLLRSDLEKIVQGAVKRRMRVNLITNGSLVDETRAKSMADAGLFSAQVSVEGPVPSVHDALTRVEGSFERTLRGIQHLVSVGISTHINTTICRGNKDHLEGIVDLAARLELPRVTMNFVIPTGTAAAEGEDQWIFYSELPPLLRDLKAYARRKGVQFIWYAPTPYCLFNPVAEGLGSKCCAACDGLLSVSPDGSVLPCSSCDQPVGNLLDAPFQEVWASPEALAWRRGEHAPPGCADCELFDLCTGACPLYWGSVGTEELKGAKRPSRRGAKHGR